MTNSTQKDRIKGQRARLTTRSALICLAPLAVSLAASVLHPASAHAEGDKGWLSISTATHYGPATGVPTGIDFTVCNQRALPKPYQDAGGADTDLANVTTSFTPQNSPDSGSFDVAAPRRGTYACTSVLVYTHSSASLSAQITYYRDGAIASASASASIPQKATTAPAPKHHSQKVAIVPSEAQNAPVQKAQPLSQKVAHQAAQPKHQSIVRNAHSAVADAHSGKPVLTGLGGIVTSPESMQTPEAAPAASSHRLGNALTTGAYVLGAGLLVIIALVGLGVLPLVEGKGSHRAAE